MPQLASHGLLHSLDDRYRQDMVDRLSALLMHQGVHLVQVHDIMQHSNLIEIWRMVPHDMRNLMQHIIGASIRLVIRRDGHPPPLPPSPPSALTSHPPPPPLAPSSRHLTPPGSRRPSPHLLLLDQPTYPPHLLLLDLPTYPPHQTDHPPFSSPLASVLVRMVTLGKIHPHGHIYVAF